MAITDSSFIDNADDGTLIQAFLDLDGDFDLCVTQGDRDRHTQSMRELQKAIESRGYTVKTVCEAGKWWKITRK
jgi:spore germination protein YaaH